MATNIEVLQMLIPDGGWYMVGDDYEGIQFLECDPITKEQFLAGFAQYENWKLEKENATKAARQVVLDKLGLTADEVAALLG